MLCTWWQCVALCEWSNCIRRCVIPNELLRLENGKSMIRHQDTGSWLLTLGHLAPWYGHQVSHHCHLNGSAESVNRNLHTLEPLRTSSGLIEIHFRLQLSTFRSSGLNLATSSSTSHLDSVVSSFTTSHSLRPLSGHWFYSFCKYCRCLFVVFTLFYVGFKSYQGCFNLPVQLPIIGQFFLWSSGRAQLGTEGLQCHG